MGKVLTARGHAAENLKRLLAREQAMRHETEILRDANIALTQNLSLDTILETFLDYLNKLVPYDSANVMLRDGDSNFVVSALRLYEGFQDVATTRAIALDGSANPLLRRICLTKQSVLVPDTNNDPGWQRVHGAEHVRNWLGVPLIASGKVIGLYSVDKAQPGFFNSEHARLAETLAARAASAIQNAQLFQASQMFSRKLIEAQEEERRRIALELHDQIGQVLTVVKINLTSVLRLCPAPEAARYIKDNTDLVDEALRLVRDLSIDLRPLLLDDLGLVTALRWYVERYAERTGVMADFRVELPSNDDRFSRDIETACFRIVQEALTNIGRHARTKQVSIQLTGDKSDLFLRVKDGGIGFDLNLLPTRPPRAATLGLLGMQERARAVGGTIEIDSALSKGTEIRVRFPIGVRTD